MDRARGNAKLWMKRHAEFHQALCDLAGRPRLSREIARIRDAADMFRKFLKDVEARSASAPSKGDTRRRGRDAGSRRPGAPRRGAPPRSI
jgi:DNA-binding GntR family transcriptional regulator